jgi:membrane protein DedA with SNARE-associated domain
VFHYNGDSSGSFYRSFGPNGVDDDGAGDDISVWGRLGFESNPVAIALASPPHVVLRFFLLLLSSLLVGVRLLWWAFHRKRSEHLPMEVACSAVLAVPPALVLAPLVVLSSGWLLGDVAKPLEGKLLTPFPVAVAGVVYGLCALFVLYYRVGRKSKAEHF